MKARRSASSGSWLGVLPKHWEVVEPRRLFQLRKQPERFGDVHLTPSQQFGVLPQKEYMELTGNRLVLNLSGTTMQHVEPGDFISHLRTFQGGLELSRSAGKVSPAYTVVTPRPGVEPEFFKYVLKSQGYVCQIASMTDQLRDGQTMRFMEFNKTALPTPPQGTQRVIADYLDHETAEIDAFISDQETFAGLLHERSRSLRSAAWGASMDGATDRTSHDQLPSIPSHWRWVRAKNLLRERGERSSTGREELLSVSHLTGVTPRSQKTVHMFEAETTVGYKMVDPGNLIINTMWAWMGALGVSSNHGIVSPAYGVYEFHEEAVDPGFYDHLLRSVEYVQLMTNHSRGLYSSRLRLYPDTFLRLPLPLPPLSEQRQISTWIHEKLESVEKTSTLLATSVDLARERRAALISAAVTGQIDVSQRHQPIAEQLEEEVLQKA